MNSKNDSNLAHELEKTKVIAEHEFDRQKIEDRQKHEMSGYTKEKDLANQIIGRIQAVNSITKLLTTSFLSDIKYIKEKKLYRTLSGTVVMTSTGGTVLDGTWKSFCKAALGSSSRTIDEQLQNLRLFGKEAYDAMQKLGVGPRAMRKLREIPEEDRTVIIQDAEVHIGDKDEIIDLIDKMAEKHSKEKEVLEKQLETSQKAVEVKAKDIDRKDSEIVRLKTEIDDLKRSELTPNEQEQAAIKRIQTAYIEVDSLFGTINLMKTGETNFNVVMKLTHLAEYMEAYGRLLRTELMNQNHQLWEGAPSDNDVYMAEDELRLKGEQLENGLPDLKLS